MRLWHRKPDFTPDWNTSDVAALPSDGSLGSNNGNITPWRVTVQELIGIDLSGLSGGAESVFWCAEQRARWYNHNYIDTEHIVIGLAYEVGDVAANVLISQSVDLNGVIAQAEHVNSSYGRVRGERIVRKEEEIGLTPQCKEVVRFAADEARHGLSRQVGTEHLLVGLLREGGGAASILRRFDFGLWNARNGLAKIEPHKMYGLTDGAERVFWNAVQCARWCNHSYVDTEHLLIALVKQVDEVAARALISRGVNLDKVLSSVEFIIGRGERAYEGERKLTPRCKDAIRLAYDEARILLSPQVGTEHLLIGLIREYDNVAAGILRSREVNLDIARRATRRIIEKDTTSNGVENITVSAQGHAQQPATRNDVWMASEVVISEITGVIKDSLQQLSAAQVVTPMLIPGSPLTETEPTPQQPLPAGYPQFRRDHPKFVDVLMWLDKGVGYEKAAEEVRSGSRTIKNWIGKFCDLFGSEYGDEFERKTWIDQEFALKMAEECGLISASVIEGPFPATPLHRELAGD